MEPTDELMTPQILFEDTHLAVVEKPAGLLSQGDSSGDPCLVDWLREHFGRHYVGLIHRLDRNTSGLLVAAKRTKSAQRLTAALQQGKVCRLYLSVVLGSVQAEMKWIHFLRKSEKNNLVTVFDTEEAQSKKSITTIRPRQQSQWNGKSISLVEFELETGRSHQIRAQSAHMGFPLVGDPKYGPPQGGRLSRPTGMMLHAFELRFPHPMSSELLRFQTKMPDRFQALGF